MKKFARIKDGLVAELLLTEGDIAAMFNPAIVWIDVSSGPAIAEGWSFDGRNFAPPPAPPVAPLCTNHSRVAGADRGACSRACSANARNQGLIHRLSR
jgi:hypothetical protein